MESATTDYVAVAMHFGVGILCARDGQSRTETEGAKERDGANGAAVAMFKVFVVPNKILSLPTTIRHTFIGSPVVCVCITRVRSKRPRAQACMPCIEHV